MSLLRTARATRERDWLMILIAFWHGLRASELVALTADNFHDGYLTVQRLKGSNKTTQALFEDSEPLLNERAGVFEFTRGMHGNQRLFPVTRSTFFRIVQRHARAAGLPRHKQHPHILKHSIAMQTIHSAGVENVRQHLGHKSLSSTGAYLKVSDEDASKAIQEAAREGRAL